MVYLNRLLLTIIKKFRDTDFTTKWSKKLGQNEAVFVISKWDNFYYVGWGKFYYIAGQVIQSGSNIKKWDTLFNMHC